MAKDYQSILDYANSLQAPSDNIMFESELPGPQPSQAPQTGGGSQGLLDVLSALGSGVGTGLLGVLQALPEVAAYRQAALGNVEPLQQIQKQKQQKKFLEQVKTPTFDPYRDQLQQLIEVGDIAGAQKLASEIPQRTAFEKTVLANPNLSDDQKTTIISQGRLNISEGFKALNEELRSQKQEQIRIRAEQRKETRQKEEEQRKRNPLNILTEAVDDGVLGSDSTQEEITGVLLSRQAKLPANAKQRETQIKQLLESPQLKTLFPNANLSWWEKIFGASEKKESTKTPPAKAAPTGFTIRRIK